VAVNAKARKKCGCELSFYLGLPNPNSREPDHWIAPLSKDNHAHKCRKPNLYSSWNLPNSNGQSFNWRDRLRDV